MSAPNLTDPKAPNVDLKLNVFSLLLPLSAMLLLYFKAHLASIGGHSVVAFTILVAGLTFFLSVMMAVAAVARKEPRRQLTIISLLFNGVLSMLFILRLFQMFSPG